MPAPTPKSTPPAPGGSAPAAPAVSEEEQVRQEPEYVDLEETNNEPFEAYTADELAQADKELKSMKPADLLQLVAYNKELEARLEDKYPFPEAGGIAFTEVSGEHGGVINLTSRARTPEIALDNLVSALKHGGANYKVKIVKRSGYARASTAVSTPPPSGQAGQTESGSVAASGRGTVLDKGTDVLNKIVIGDGFVEFHVGKFKYPFKDSRLSWDGGKKIIADLFDASLGWREDHFAAMGKYEQGDWGATYYVDWEHVENNKTHAKYYNVVRIHQ